MLPEPGTARAQTQGAFLYGRSMAAWAGFGGINESWCLMIKINRSTVDGINVYINLYKRRIKAWIHRPGGQFKWLNRQRINNQVIEYQFGRVHVTVRIQPRLPDDSLLLKFRYYIGSKLR